MIQKQNIAEIARLANVSIATVDRALHGRSRIRSETRQRILSIAQAVGYTPNLAARALSRGRSALRVGISIPRELHFYFDDIRDGAISEAGRSSHLGVGIVDRPPEHLEHGEAKALQDLILEKVDVIITTVGDSSRIAPIIDEAESQGIRVICVDTDVPGSVRSSVVCVDAGASGGLAAELLGQLTPPASQVAVITGTLRVEDHQTKTAAFSHLFPDICEGGSVVAVIEAHDDEDEALQKSLDLLRDHRNLQGIYVSTGNCLPVCRAICAQGLSGKIKLVTTELFAEMAPYFEKRTIAASINSQAHRQGQVAMRMAIDYLLQGSQMPHYVYVMPQIVMRSNLHLFSEMRNPQKQR